MKISIVIPVYNEERVIAKCLEAISLLGVKPYEVVLVDNNSTDQTVAIAKKYKFVTVITEKKQGLIAARNAGFAVATGDILARIDADTHVSPNWTYQIEESFQDNKTAQAITGTGYFYDAPAPKTYRAIRNFVAVRLNSLLLGHDMLWGSNMAIRRTAWDEIKDKTCVDKNIMEDLDIAAHLVSNYGKKSVKFIPNMQADISFRRAASGLKSNYFYLKQWPDTLRAHGYKLYFVIWPFIFLGLPFAAIASASVRLYDVSKKKMVFSIKKWQEFVVFDAPNP